MADMWTPEPNIEQSRRSAQNFWQTPQGGYGSGWGAALAALGSGVGYGMFSSDANTAEKSNQQFRADTMTRAAQAPDGTSMAKILMGSGIPGMDTQGLSTITAERNRAASQAFQQQQAAENRAHQERMARLQFQNQQALREEPEIVRTLKAAGYAPGSPEFQDALRSTIKGQNPLDQAKVQVLREMGLLPAERPTAPPQQPGARLIPQSDDGTSDPNLIPIQSGAPAPQPQPQPSGGVMQGLTPQQRAGVGLSILGMGDAGKIIADAGNQGAMGKEGQNELDKQVIAKVTDIGDLENIAAKYNKDYLGLKGAAQGTLLEWQDWLSGGIKDPQQKAWFDGYSKFATATTERLNNKIKALSGAAVSGAEEKRMYAANPTVKDGPDRFESKLKEQLDMQRMAVARYNWLRTQYKGTPEQIAALAKSGKIEMFPLDGMKKIYNDRAVQIDQELRQANPQARPEQINQARRARLRGEFGI